MGKDGKAGLSPVVDAGVCCARQNMGLLLRLPAGAEAGGERRLPAGLLLEQGFGFFATSLLCSALLSVPVSPGGPCLVFYEALTFVL